MYFFHRAGIKVAPYRWQVRNALPEARSHWLNADVFENPKIWVANQQKDIFVSGSPKNVYFFILKQIPSIN